MKNLLNTLIALSYLSAASVLFAQQPAAEKASPAATAGKADASSSGPLIVNIDNPNFRRLVVAIPKFATASGSSKADLEELSHRGASELSRLLTFSGLFNIMSDAAYQDILTKQNLATENPVHSSGVSGVDMQQWKAIGIESLTLAELSGNSKVMEIALKTIDMNRGEVIVGRKFSKVERKDFDLVMRRYADLVLEAYTGKSGIFNSKLVFVGRKAKGEDKQIFISDFDGSNLIQITREKVPHVSPTWSRDGRFITYTSYKDGNPDLFIYELATGKARKLSGSPGINSGSNWSHNNQWVAFSGAVAGDVNIYLVKPEGGTRVPFVEGAGLDVDPSFSPDGQWFAFVSGRYGNPHIFRAQLQWEGEKIRIVGDKRLTYAGWYNASPAWSPTSDKLAFAGYDKDIDRFDLFMMNPDGTSMERLTLRAGDNESPSWAPNGQMIVYHSNRVGTQDRKGPGSIYVMNRDGSSQRRIDVGLYEAQTPSWSPQLQ
jgi:TolB protein